MNAQLLAKGTPDFTPLSEHLRAVQEAGHVILNAVEDRVIHALALPADTWAERLRAGVSWACRLHDIGKANAYFQLVLKGKANGRTQPVRHDLISALLLLSRDLGLRDPLLQELPGPDAEHLLSAILGAVCGHHLKPSSDWSLAAQALQDEGAPTTVEVLLDAPELAPILPDGAAPKRFTLAKDNILDDKAVSLTDLRRQFLVASSKWQAFCREHDDWRRFCGGLRALLMAADAAGSAEATNDCSLHDWMAKALSETLSEDDCTRVAEAGLDDHSPRPFQQEVADVNDRVAVVQAGCGSGKTSAAYLWAQRHAVGRKLFFCYPTTGTSTEGFKDYLAGASVLTDLVHSRAHIDLEHIQYSPEDDDLDALLRADSLRSWAPRITACTVDTVIALARNCRRGMYSSPALFSGAFVFDEVHSYDTRLFEGLLLLMEALPGADFLLLSASIQPARRAVIEEHFPNARWIDGPADWEGLPRYRLARDGEDSCREQVAEVLADGGKVLWISNTVARACSAAEAVERTPALVYHSRFRYQDRAALHRQVVDSFKEPGAVLACTTQVAEMSLNIDADLMVTDLAPVPSLIQRLGRLNRRATVDKPSPSRPALLLEPKNPAPYSPDDLDTARTWLESLGEGPVSQADLKRAWHAVDCGAVSSLRGGCEWLDTGWISWPGDVREAGYTIRALLARNERACRADSREIARWEIPVLPNGPVALAALHRLRGRPIIPEDTFTYSCDRGFEWKR